MEIRDVRAFVVLAEHLHFGRAARLLHLSQPALTKQIQRLEAELGSALFERGRHGARLTSYGRQWLGEARSVVEKFEQLKERGRLAARGEIGRLLIGFGFHTFELVPWIVAKMRRTAPGIEVGLRDMST